MSIDIKKYPRSLKVNITAINDNSGYEQLTVTGVNSEYDFRLGQQIRIFTILYNGKYTITDITYSGGGIVLLTINKTYSATSTGFVLTDDAIPVNSYWGACVKTPLVFEFQRKDITDVYVYSATTNAKIRIPGDYDSLYGLSVGDYIYINGYNSYGSLIYNDVVEITSLSYSSGLGYSFIDVDLPFNGVSSLAFVNIAAYKEDYYIQLTIECELFDNDIVTKFYPDSKGIVYCNIQSYLEAHLTYIDQYNQNDSSYKDTDLFGIFNVTIQEVWDGGSETEIELSENFFFSFSQKELQKYSNLFENLVKNSGDKPIAKFLNKGVPEIWVKNGIVQHPIDVSILSTPGILNKVEVKYNESKTQISSTDVILNDCHNSLNRIAIPKDIDQDVVYWLGIYLKISLTGIHHFAEEIPLSGIIYDQFLTSNGQLTKANCLSCNIGTVFRFKEDIGINSSTITFNSDLITTGDLSISDNEMTIGVAGKLYNLQFEDNAGNQYNFPLVERYSDNDKGYYLMHGWVELVSGGRYNAYMFAVDINGFDTQTDYFFQVREGMDKNIDGGDEIWVHKDNLGNSLYSEGIDSYQYDNFILE